MFKFLKKKKIPERTYFRIHADDMYRCIVQSLHKVDTIILMTNSVRREERNVIQIVKKFYPCHFEIVRKGLKFENGKRIIISDFDSKLLKILSKTHLYLTYEGYEGKEAFLEYREILESALLRRHRDTIYEVYGF